MTVAPASRRTRHDRGIDVRHESIEDRSAEAEGDACDRYVVLEADRLAGQRPTVVTADVASPLPGEVPILVRAGAVPTFAGRMPQRWTIVLIDAGLDELVVDRELGNDEVAIRSGVDVVEVDSELVSDPDDLLGRRQREHVVLRSAPGELGRVTRDVVETAAAELTVLERAEPVAVDRRLRLARGERDRLGRSPSSVSSEMVPYASTTSARPRVSGRPSAAFSSARPEQLHRRIRCGAVRTAPVLRWHALFLHQFAVYLTTGSSSVYQGKAERAMAIGTPGSLSIITVGQTDPSKRP